MIGDANLAYREFLERMDQEGIVHDEAQTEHREKRLNLDRETARLVQLLILTGRRRRVLEIGTSNGYSALWIADALRRIPGAHPLITVERNPTRCDEAARNLGDAGLAEWAEIRVGEATELIPRIGWPL